MNSSMNLTENRKRGIVFWGLSVVLVSMSLAHVYGFLSMPFVARAEPDLSVTAVVMACCTQFWFAALYALLELILIDHRRFRWAKRALALLFGVLLQTPVVAIVQADGFPTPWGWDADPFWCAVAVYGGGGVSVILIAYAIVGPAMFRRWRQGHASAEAGRTSR
jgi:hypothetical protein